MIQKLISRLNLHLPLQRFSIAQLLNDPELEIQSRSGAKFKPRRSELIKLSQMLNQQELGRYLIPIILELHSDGSARARGLDAELIAKLLGMEFDSAGAQLWLNQIQLQKLRSEYPSLIQYLLTIPDQARD